MGTNYYAVKKKPCLYDREIHIGKCSMGWLFLFQDNDQFHTYPQLKKWLEENVDTGEYVLLDEEEQEITTSELLEIIDKKQNDPHDLSNPDNFSNAKNIDGYRFASGDFS